VKEKGPNLEGASQILGNLKSDYIILFYKDREKILVSAGGGKRGRMGTS